MRTQKTLCDLESNGFIKTNFGDYKKMVRNGEFVCKACGRVANKKKYLCEPKRLYPKKS
jgi:hypothetical protein